jgi:hypothetical protein
LDGETHYGNGIAGTNLNEDDSIKIGDNYVHIADQLKEMVCDAMGYDGYTSTEFETLERKVRDEKTPVYPGYKTNTRSFPLH